ncbi:hypothetical protein HW511_00525 [Asaia siamensis]|uniref:Hint domain-containing protein n=1 Tax=Asaia siamensis TaxID=110479 RepID=A0ABQ1M4P6_9PROT|nr:hypothetical protein [Asaia siamensis]GBR06263.1 hypothetical protein AA0323_1328 [Asaia siamensis NRIC 0323]GGC34674.1 hypothetical protein GCM10007207_20240 [Asaia siamensis]
MRAMQQRVDAGFARAARRLGTIGRHYRVVDPLKPLSTLMGTPFLCFDADAGFQMRKPRMWARPMVYALSDAPSLCIGDILQQEERFYFVAEIEAFRPPLCVACNKCISIFGMRGVTQLHVGQCPASIVLTGKGEDSHSGMPGALRSGSYMLSLPVLPGFYLVPYMQIIDELGLRYTVDSVELSRNGTRAIVSLQQI